MALPNPTRPPLRFGPRYAQRMRHPLASRLAAAARAASWLLVGAALASLAVALAAAAWALLS